MPKIEDKIEKTNKQIKKKGLYPKQNINEYSNVTYHQIKKQYD